MIEVTQETPDTLYAKLTKVGYEKTPILHKEKFLRKKDAKVTHRIWWSRLVNQWDKAVGERIITMRVYQEILTVETHDSIECYIYIPNVIKRVHYGTVGHMKTPTHGHNDWDMHCKWNKLK